MVLASGLLSLLRNSEGLAGRSEGISSSLLGEVGHLVSQHWETFLNFEDVFSVFLAVNPLREAFSERTVSLRREKKQTDPLQRSVRQV